MSRRDDGQDLFGFKSVGDLVSKVAPKRPSRIQQRLIESSVSIEEDDPRSLAFQHTVFCQTGMPYRDVGPDVTVWERAQGRARLRVEAGIAADPVTQEFIRLGLPHGPKPRLILAYLNGQALRTSSPVIEVEDSLTAFVKRLGLASKGQNMRIIKDQLARISAARITLGLFDDNRAVTVDSKIVTAFDLWFPKDERQKVLWPTTVQLSLDYFESLQKHAVPLDERAIASLSHSAMGLDIYAWLAQRLHRVHPHKPQFIPWTALKEQFGWHYTRMRKFREVFTRTLGMVLTQYRGARVEADGKGLTLRNSPPPVKGRMAVVRRCPTDPKPLRLPLHPAHFHKRPKVVVHKALAYLHLSTTSLGRDSRLLWGGFAAILATSLGHKPIVRIL